MQGVHIVYLSPRLIIESVDNRRVVLLHRKYGISWVGDGDHYLEVEGRVVGKGLGDGRELIYF